MRQMGIAVRFSCQGTVIGSAAGQSAHVGTVSRQGHKLWSCSLSEPILHKPAGSNVLISLLLQPVMMLRQGLLHCSSALCTGSSPLMAPCPLLRKSGQ